MRTLILFILFLLSFAGTASADPTSEFSKGNEQFAAGKFQEAAETYEGIVRSGHWHADLFYNLGNARYRAGDIGRAILNYERALAMEPKHPEAGANLRVARDEARALELQQGSWERYASRATVSQYIWTAAMSFWAAIFLAAILYFRHRRSPVVTLLMASAVLLCATAIVAIYGHERGPNGRATAIVIDKNIQARVATADNANTVLMLPPGSQVKVLSVRGDWTYAALPNNLSGWIPTASAERLRL